ncbi:pyruvate kinase [Oharaeibacter diazotrophicus]|uniref:Pyruvate kinase n=2 Tax=Oharaeibacter diazotrophicus TaxID=1920512 RepID=A0A4R6RH28_9HYPH|nr:pyruvate kinase [Oharaeibacter diazotrophicus]TDP85445.1 pyruvate kinase [Oharaeibacter diazotrophicus]BBE74415.1 pyruvate kinase [Pleomorphomonas sp. SM30]GLS75889.1 pyruvate kinase [Oharaeibacter diazotrophicus]
MTDTVSYAHAVVPTGDDRTGLAADLAALRDAVVADGEARRAAFAAAHGPIGPGIANLADYLALRRHDIRPLQRALMARGLSSLGRAESRVLPTLDAVAVALAALAGRPAPVEAPGDDAFFAGERLLAANADAALGPRPAGRDTRIMVTLPSEAAGDPGLVLDLARRGMDIARINCAHDGIVAWEAMARAVRTAGEIVGRPIRVLMDIAGPKIRTEAVVAADKARRIVVGDTFSLVAGGTPEIVGDAVAAASVSLPEIVTRIGVGDRVLYNDGKMEARVEAADGASALLRVTRVRAGGVKLKPEKGLNLPDTALGLSPLTAKDIQDLAAVVRTADMIGYSFVSRPEDIDLLETVLADTGLVPPSLGLVAKIERPEAVANLPALMARVAGRRPFAVMIARGDLAAEIGFERLAEMQEEILWLCEAASVPVIWATQVLESLVRDGLPSRGEMTDAAMGARAECVMLNKGPHVGTAVDVLDHLLVRMAGHVHKKTPMLRALGAWSPSDA